MKTGDVVEIPFFVKKTLVTPNFSNDVMLCVLNCSPSPRLVYKGEIIALCVPQNRYNLI